MKHLDLFAGIGGFALAAQMLGRIDTVQFVEIDPYCQRVLSKNFPGIPVYGDITTFTAEPGRYELVTGGFPCQDNSCANYRGKGLDGHRSGLWFEMQRVIAESRPRFVVVENVSPTASRRWDVVVRTNLEKLGYETEALKLSAKDMGANHLRKRLFIIAYTGSERDDSIENPDRIPCPQAQVKSSTWWANGGELRRGHSGRVFLLPRSWVGRVDDGFSSRLDVDRLRGLGNAVVPQCAMVALQRVLSISEALGDRSDSPATHTPPESASQ